MDLYGINKVLLLLNERGDPSFLFQNLSFYNVSNQLAKFEKNLSVGSNFSGMTLILDYAFSGRGRWR